MSVGHFWGASARAHVHTPHLYLENGWTDCAEIWHVASGQLVKWLPQINGGVTIARAHVHTLTPRIYLGNGWTDCADIWHVGSDQFVMWLRHAHGVSLCTWARAHPASISWERLNWLCSNLLSEQRPIWYVASTKQWGCQCTCAIAHSTSFRVLAWIGWFKVDDCGIVGCAA